VSLQTHSTNVWANQLWYRHSYPSVESLQYDEPQLDFIVWPSHGSPVLLMQLKVFELRTRPTWLPIILERLRGATSSDQGMIESRQYISPATAQAARDFFERYGHLFANEPDIYPTMQGDLACEFQGFNSKATVIVAPAFLVVYANVGKESAYLCFRDWRSEHDKVADGIRNLRLK
jgi:hypothetical protein